MATHTDGGHGPDEAPSGDGAGDRTMAESIGARCLVAARADDGPLYAYLAEERKVEKKPIKHAIEHGTLGLSLWTHSDMTRGTVGFGGPAAAFLVRDRIQGQVVGVDLRYFDAEPNGGKAHCSKGETVGYPWVSDWKRLEGARTVYVVDSPINALSVESCVLPGSAVLATRGLVNVARTDWSFLRGKAVVVCFGNDPVADKGPDFGYCPGLRAAWQLHEILTGLDISCLLVDQASWFEDAERKKPIRDTNQYLQVHGWERLTTAMKQLEEWVIPGLPAEGKREGRARLWFPTHDWFSYTKYRVQPDFTRTLKEQVKDEATGETRWTYNDVAGFRVAAISRVEIASPGSTMTGDADTAPTTLFAISVQTARHGARLLRRVVDDEKLHNLDVWKKVGPVFAPQAFSRMLNFMERSADIGARRAINLVGLGWRDGKVVVNEGPDCFFQDPRQQCPYHALSFPQGQPGQGMEVIRAFQRTFKDNAAALPLVWALGTHLKAFLGFWPHFVMQAEKGSGKSTLIKRLERSVAMTMFSRQSMGSEFRILTTISYTTHPVGWEEISQQRRELIDKAVAQLQESYQYSHTRRGADMMDFLLCAPVLLAGEDVPVEALTGKVVRCQLAKAKRGPLLADNLPVFPVKQWLQFLASLGKAEVLQLQAEMVKHFTENCVAAATDAGAERMVVNYAAIATAWQLLCDFTGLPAGSWAFVDSAIAEMNSHITESAGDRQPWAQIMDKLLSEIASKQFRYPFKFDTEDEVDVLCVRTNHVMAHLSQSPNLRQFYDAMSVKSDRAFKQQLGTAGVLLTEKGTDKPLHLERTVHGQRVSHMVAVNLKALEKFGLHATRPVDDGLPPVDGSYSTQRKITEPA